MGFLFGKKKEEEEKVSPYTFGVIYPWNCYWSERTHLMYAVPYDRDLYSGTFIRMFDKDGAMAYIPKEEWDQTLTEADKIGTFTHMQDAVDKRTQEFMDQFTEDSVTTDGFLEVMQHEQDIPTKALFHYVDLLSTDGAAHAYYPEAMAHLNNEISYRLKHDLQCPIRPDDMKRWINYAKCAIESGKAKMLEEQKQRAKEAHEKALKPKGRMGIDI